MTREELDALCDMLAENGMLRPESDDGLIEEDTEEVIREYRKQQEGVLRDD